MTEQEMEAMARCGALCEHHEKFRPFEGTFRTEVKMWMGPGEPMVSTGTMVNTLDLGGRFLRQEYTGDANDGPFPNFEGRGFWGYNTVDKRYESVWIDNAGTMMMMDTGQVDEAGTTWEMGCEMTCPMSGERMKKRSVIRLIDHDHHVMEMYHTGPDGTEVKCMEITYTRA